MSIGQALTIIKNPAGIARTQQRIQKRPIIIIFAKPITAACQPRLHQIITVVTVTVGELSQIHIEHHHQAKRYVTQCAKTPKGNHPCRLGTNLLAL